jgi:hypothetical protein
MAAPSAEGRAVTPASTPAPPRTIRKRQSEGLAPNMPDYERARAEFSWAAAAAQLAPLPGGDLNFLNVVVAIHDQTGIDIPERDYGKPSTLGDAVAYLTGAQKQAADA